MCLSTRLTARLRRAAARHPVIPAAGWAGGLQQPSRYVNGQNGVLSMCQIDVCRPVDIYGTIGLLWERGNSLIGVGPMIVDNRSGTDRKRHPIQVVVRRTGLTSSRVVRRVDAACTLTRM
jgi:hypothetical protein